MLLGNYDHEYIREALDIMDPTEAAKSFELIWTLDMSKMRTDDQLAYLKAITNLARVLQRLEATYINDDKN